MAKRESNPDRYMSRPEEITVRNEDGNILSPLGDDGNVPDSPEDKAGARAGAQGVSDGN